MENNKLTIDEAKKIYNNYLVETDLNKKNELRNKLISGTLYYVDILINNNDFVKIFLNKYSIDDIKNSAYEVWIELVDNGELLKLDSFKNNFNEFSVIFNGIYSKLNSNVIKNLVFIPRSVVIDSLIKYREYIKNNDRNDNYLNVIINDNLKKLDSKYLSSFSKYVDVEIYYLIKTFLDNVDDEVIYLSEKKFDRFFNTFYYLVVYNNECQINNNISYDVIDGYIYSSAFYEIMFEALNILDDIQRNIIIDRYGFYGIPMTMVDTAKKYGLSKDRIQHIEYMALKKLRYYFNDKKNNKKRIYNKTI